MSTLRTDARESALRELIQQQEAAWNRGDAAAWAAPFSEDASFVTLRGDILPGRQAIEKSHQMIFNSFYKGSHDLMTIEAIQFLSAEVALIDVMHAVTNYSFLPPGVVPTEPGILRARMRFIAVLKKEYWRFVAAQNTAVSPKPAPAAASGDTHSSAARRERRPPGILADERSAQVLEFVSNTC